MMKSHIPIGNTRDGWRLVAAIIGGFVIGYVVNAVLEGNRQMAERKKVTYEIGYTNDQGVDDLLLRRRGDHLLIFRDNDRDGRVDEMLEFIFTVGFFGRYRDTNGDGLPDQFTIWSDGETKTQPVHYHRDWAY